MINHAILALHTNIWHLHLSQPEETRLISESGGLFSAETVARSAVHDALSGNFASTVGTESLMVRTVCCGMTPPSSGTFFFLAAKEGSLFIDSLTRYRRRTDLAAGDDAGLQADQRPLPLLLSPDRGQVPQCKTQQVSRQSGCGWRRRRLTIPGGGHQLI